MTTHRVLVATPPFAEPNADTKRAAGTWPAKWIGTHTDDKPSVRAFRLRFNLENAQTTRVHVTADNRYELFLNGERIGRGSERGDERNWFFETYDLALDKGENVLVARVWWLPSLQTPFAQHSVHAGFVLCPDDENLAPLLATGVANWDVKELGGYSFTSPQMAWGTGDNVVIDGAQFAWNFERGEGDSWSAVNDDVAAAIHYNLFRTVNARSANDLHFSHELRPATLPPQIDELRHVGRVVLVSEIEALKTCDVPLREIDNIDDEREVWQKLILSNGDVVIPAHAKRRVLVDFEDYLCAYPELKTSGGAGSAVRIHWQESLFESPKNSTDKGNRDETEGKYFRQIWADNDGIGDTFLPDGGESRFFTTLWWQCGRYVEIVVETREEPLTIESLAWRETRYPTVDESSFSCDDNRVLDVAPIMLRALQMCSHETYMDCPWYEQLQYIGDTRLQALTSYTLMRDDRLARKAIFLFDESRMPEGLTYSRYPSRALQFIHGFSLWWVAMVHDYALWRDDLAFVKARMHGVRSVLDGYERFVNQDGLVQLPQDTSVLNFMDWVPGWEGGTPPSENGIDAPAAMQRVLVLRQAAELEELFGEKEMAIRWRRRARAGEDAIVKAFWNDERGLFADNSAHSNYSEHAQCLAVLTYARNGFAGHEDKIARASEALVEAPDLSRTTIYFAHYLFETYKLLGRMDLYFARLELWFGLKQNGLKTTIEMPEPTRSDCHAWGAHPLYHNFSSLLGIRPTSFGFSGVEIAPQLAHLKEASGTMPHPHGEISVDVKRIGETLHATISLPEGVSGVFRQGEQTVELHSGTQEVSV